MFRPASTMPVDFPAPVYRALDGHAELAVAEAAGASGGRPRRVTAIIAALCEQLGDRNVDEDIARQVSAAGREWLLLQAGLRFFGTSSWFEAPCGLCGARFDLDLTLADVPQSRAGRGFPEVEVPTSLGLRRFEAPNGFHEEAFARRRGGDPRRHFARLCGLSDDAADEAGRFDETDLTRIDAALEAISPDVADFVDAVCPDCGGANRVRIDPLTFAFPRPETVLRDVHAIASAYRWNEDAILAMPSVRRRAYASLIGGGTPRARTRRLDS